MRKFSSAGAKNHFGVRIAPVAAIKRIIRDERRPLAIRA